MWYAVTLPLFVLVSIAQTSTIPSFSLFGAHADVLLVVVSGWAVIRKLDEAMRAAPLAALLAGLLGAGPIGIPLLSLLAPIGLTLLTRERPGGRPAQLGLVVALSTFWALGLELTVDVLSGEHGLRLAGAGDILLGTLLLNLLLAALIYWPLRLRSTRPPGRRARLSLS